MFENIDHDDDDYNKFKKMTDFKKCGIFAKKLPTILP
jgi:hypothetical protein